MKKILISLLLVVACNEILGRTIMPWHKSNMPYWHDYDYDLFNPNSDGIANFMMAAESEELKETLKPLSANNNNDADDDANDDDDDVLSNFFGNLLGSILAVSDESTDNDQIVPTKIDDIYKNVQLEKDNDDNNDDDKNVMEFEIHISNIFLTKDPNSSEEAKNVNENEENKSSEENLFSFFENDKSDENSNEIKSKSNNNNNDGIEIYDLTKSSEEKKSEIDNNDADDVDINENDIKNLAQLFVTLNILEDLVKISSESRNPDNEAKAKEVDQYLTLFSAVLDKATEEEKKLIEKNNIEEDNKTTTTPKNDSDENDKDNDDDDDDDDDNDDDKNDDDDKDKNKNNNASDSNEDDTNLTSLAFYEINDETKQTNLNDHQYAVVDSTQDFMATSSPFLPEMLTTPNSDNQNAIHKYVEIRENLDNQQNTLQNNEITLDKDFYSIIASNYDDESINKFEKDIYVVHENLDRIKRNINAMQNLQSKLYLHKLITAAVKDAQKNKLQN